MKLDDRARRAVDDLRDLIGPDRDGGATLDRFDRTRLRRHRHQRIGTAIVAIALAASALGLVIREFRPPDRRPLEPVIPPGVILYGQDSRGNLTQWFTVGTDGSGVRDLHLSATCAAWFPTGDRILVTDDADLGPRGLLRPAVLDPSGTSLHPLAGAGNAWLNLGCGEVSPDGSRIAIEGFGTPGHNELNGIYSVRTSDGGGAVRLVDGPIEVPSFSPDGTRVVFRKIGGSCCRGAGALYVMPSDGGAATRIVARGTVLSLPKWSPTGRWIVFAGPTGQLSLIHPDGSGLHAVAITLPPGADLHDPSWSPDGRWLVFDVSGTGSGIYVVRTDGTDLRKIVTARRVKAPVWTTDP